MYRFLIFFLSTVTQRFLVISSRVWPQGLYGLPKPRSGCPDEWKVGYRKQDLENTHPSSQFSSNLQLHMDATLTQERDIERRFCVKNSHQNGKARLWPDGSYCVYQKGSVCPSGMKTGAIKWDDEDQKPSKNAYNGTLPDGTYNEDTIIKFCCQDRGSWNDTIELPIDRPFYLLPHKSTNCQRVKGAISTLEWITYDTENFINLDNFQQSHVFADGRRSRPKIYYCYYVGCQHKLQDAENGTISASHFSSYQYCSWSITVKQASSVYLKFISINIPKCGSIYMNIYDGLDNTAPLLLILCGVNATSGIVLRSSGNHMFVTLRSDAPGDNVHFHAYYDTATPFTGMSWPSGTYGLPKTLGPCPDKWVPGWRKQIMEDDTGLRETSFSADLLAHMDISLANYSLTRHFCMKTIDNGKNQQVWPAGEYCIYKKNQCPVGMKQGSIKMDDEDIPKTDKNDKGGIIPDGSTARDTEIFYCCSDRGKWNEWIELPTHETFYLLPHQSKNCQRVKWALSTLDHITYDTENNVNLDNFRGSFPYKEGKKGRPTIFYCYYEGCEYKLRNDSGSFGTLDYPDYQLCSWSITVQQKLQIFLEFTTMSISNCAQGNQLQIYDGADSTASILATYCGENASAGNTIRSTKNNLYLVFKSGDNSGRTLQLEATYKSKPQVSDNSPSTSSKTLPTTSLTTSSKTSPKASLTTLPDTLKTSSTTSPDTVKMPPTTSASISPTFLDDNTSTDAVLSNFTEMTQPTEPGVIPHTFDTEEETRSTVKPHESGTDERSTSNDHTSSLVIVIPVCITVLAIVLIVMAFYRKRIRKDDGNTGTTDRATTVSNQRFNSSAIFTSPESVSFEKNGGLPIESPKGESSNHALQVSEKADQRYQNNRGANTTDSTYCTIDETKEEYEKGLKYQHTYEEPINAGASKIKPGHSKCGRNASPYVIPSLMKASKPAPPALPPRNSDGYETPLQTIPHPSLGARYESPTNQPFANVCNIPKGINNPSYRIPHKEIYEKMDGRRQLNFYENTGMTQ